MRKMEGNTGDEVATIAGEIAQPVSLRFDPNRYRAELDSFDLTEEQKRELMAALWEIMCRFVQLGFSVDVCSALLGDETPAIPSSDELR